MKRALRSAVRAPRAALIALIGLYRRWLSPALPRRCKYEPTCSAYAAEALRELGVLRGGVVATWRLLRCNPFSHGGYDPLAQRTLFRGNGASRLSGDPGTTEGGARP